jgi:hypothetical protein
VNTKLVEMLCRRAISVTTAPGASVSSMIRILSPRDQRRRRSIPPELLPASTDLKASLKARSSPDTCNSTRRPTPEEYAWTDPGSSLLGQARRLFFVMADLAMSPLAPETVRRIDAPLEIERTINRQSAERAKQFTGTQRRWWTNAMD